MVTLSYFLAPSRAGVGEGMFEPVAGALEGADFSVVFDAVHHGWGDDLVFAQNRPQEPQVALGLAPGLVGDPLPRPVRAYSGRIPASFSLNQTADPARPTWSASRAGIRGFFLQQARIAGLTD